jgi:microsomal dipeptidase-like Zn-dependent dipeptidase
MIELTNKQKSNLLEFWQTAQIDSSLRSLYCSVDVSAITNKGILDAITKTLTYVQGKYIAFSHSDFDQVLENIRNIS